MIQIDMEMPKNCDDCPMLDDYGDYPFCLVSREQRGYNFLTREKRMPKCPLHEVDAELVKHGRWIKRGYACGESEYKCSVCGETEWRTNCERMKYCMFCGARMDGEANDHG